MVPEADRRDADQTAAAMAKVTMMWLVKVNAPGIIPSMLPIRMKMKIVNTIGKKRMPSLPVASRNIPATNSYVIDEGLQPPRDHGMLAGPGHDQQVGAADRDHHPQRGVRERQVMMRDADRDDSARSETVPADLPRACLTFPFDPAFVSRRSSTGGSRAVLHPAQMPLGVEHARSRTQHEEHYQKQWHRAQPPIQPPADQSPYADAGHHLHPGLQPRARTRAWGAARRRPASSPAEPCRGARRNPRTTGVVLVRPCRLPFASSRAAARRARSGAANLGRGARKCQGGHHLCGTMP